MITHKPIYLIYIAYYHGWAFGPINFDSTTHSLKNKTLLNKYIMENEYARI